MAGHPPPNSPFVFFEMRTRTKPWTRRIPLFSLLLLGWNCPPPNPAGVASSMAKGCAIDILKTRFSVLHRSIAFRSGARLRCVSFWWQDKSPVRDTDGAEGKRMYLTSKNQNASTVRKVLAGLRFRRNAGGGEMW